MNVLEEYAESGRVKPANLKEASTEELLELKQEVDTNIAAIGGELMEAKANATAHGEYSDPDWFRRATMAKKMKGQLSQRIQTALSKKKAEQKEKNRRENEQTFEKRLLKAMDMVLEPEVKEQVLEKARNLVEEYA
jgi:ubiquitin